MNALLERANRFTDADEPVRYVITGQRGTKPTWRFVTFWLIVTNKPRIIAVTSKRILVLRAGQLRTARTKPRELLYEVPRATVMGPLQGSWSKVQLGGEGIWVSRNTYPLIEKANAEVTSAGSPSDATDVAVG